MAFSEKFEDVMMVVAEKVGDLDWQLHPNTSHIHPYMYG